MTAAVRALSPAAGAPGMRTWARAPTLPVPSITAGRAASDGARSSATPVAGSSPMREASALTPRVSMTFTSLARRSPRWRRRRPRAACPLSVSIKAVSSQRRKDPSEEGPGHLGSWQPPVGETRRAKRCDKGSHRGAEQACGLRLPRRHMTPRDRDQGGAEPVNGGEGHGRRKDPGAASKNLPA
jgi:hypothetical protein